MEKYSAKNNKKIAERLLKFMSPLRLKDLVFIGSVFVPIVGYYAIYNEVSESRGLAVIFLFSAIFSWYDFGIVRYFQIRTLREKAFPLNITYPVLLSVCACALFLFVASLASGFQLLLYSFAAAISSLCMLFMRSVFEASGRSFEGAILNNITSGTTLFVDALYFGLPTLFLIRPLIVLPLTQWLKLQKVLEHERNLEGINFSKLFLVQTAQLVPANFERIYTLSSDFTTSNNFFVAEVVNRLAPIIGQYLNSKFFERLRLQVNEQALPWTIAIVPVLLWFGNDVIFACASLALIGLNIPLYMNAVFSGKQYELATIYFIETIFTAVFALNFTASLFFASLCRIYLDHVLLFAISRRNA